MDPIEIAVIGAGSWGTALAKVLAEAGHLVTLWGRAAAHMAEVAATRCNLPYLPGVALPASLVATADLEAAVRGKPVVVSVLPSHTVRQVMTRARGALAPEVLLVSASKGIENDTLFTMDELLGEVVPPELQARFAYLSGPSFATEVAAGLPTAVVIAASARQTAERSAALFQSGSLRVYTSDDVIGVELGGALKNVMAIATGVADGLGLGDNARAALITRGLAEIARLAVRRGANPLTLAGLAGLGDLVLTCTGDLSRNRSVGLRLGRGESIDAILGGMAQVAEGVRTTLAAHDLSRRLGVEMPVTEVMYRVLYHGLAARDAVSDLMGRAPRHELG